MYKNVETETSYQYLAKVISHLKEPICILGGWAVYFAVQEQYEKQMKRAYLGSRDIDLGFHDAATFLQAAKILEEKLHFRSISARYFKSVHAETGKDLTEEQAKQLPRHMFFHMYVDPILSHTNPGIKKELGFSPIDEPLLAYAFENEKYRKNVKEFGRKLLLPTTSILLATKINSILNRDKEHKRIKDLCDIVALCLFGDTDLDELIKTAIGLLPKKTLQEFKKMNLENDMATCSKILGLELSTVRSTIDKIYDAIRYN